MAQKPFYMVEEDVIDKNQRTRIFDVPILLDRMNRYFYLHLGNSKNIWANLCSPPPKLFWSLTAMYYGMCFNLSFAKRLTSEECCRFHCNTTAKLVK